MLGFHRAGRWDEVIDVEECLLTTEVGNEVRDAVAGWARSERLEPYDQETQEGYLRHLVVREGRNTGQLLVLLVTAPGELFDADFLIETLTRFPEVRSIHWAVNDRHRRGHEPPDEAALGRGVDRGGAARPALPRAAERVPADEHGDGRDALHARARRGGAHRHGDGLRPLLRHRDDRPCARRGRRLDLGRRDLGGVRRVCHRERAR